MCGREMRRGSGSAPAAEAAGYDAAKVAFAACSRGCVAGEERLRSVWRGRMTPRRMLLHRLLLSIGTGLLAAGAEEGAEHVPCLGGEDAGHQLNAMVQARVLDQVA